MSRSARCSANRGPWCLPIVLGCVLGLLSGCAAGRQPVPAGVIPKQTEVPASDEHFGHQVFSQLSEAYPIDRDDGRINRVRDIVARLTEQSGNSHNIWHVHVLVGDDVQNAAATRGNYIFVWTGMLKTVQNDDELAAILAHELAHVLAGHTQPTPVEEVNRIIAQAAGLAARQAVYQQGSPGVLASLAGTLAQEALQAFIINPESQRKELEADTIGMFLMADAGYDPELAVRFWERLQSDPAFSGHPVQFLSSHPSSAERLSNLKRHLPDALARYRGTQSDSFRFDPTQRARPVQSRTTRDGKEVWVVADEFAAIHVDRSERSTLLVELPRGSEVSVDGLEGRWLRISHPVRGYARSYRFAPR